MEDKKTLKFRINRSDWDTFIFEVNLTQEKPSTVLNNFIKEYIEIAPIDWVIAPTPGYKHIATVYGDNNTLETFKDMCKEFKTNASSQLRYFIRDYIDNKELERIQDPEILEAVQYARDFWSKELKTAREKKTVKSASLMLRLTPVQRNQVEEMADYYNASMTEIVSLLLLRGYDFFIKEKSQDKKTIYEYGDPRYVE